MFLKLINFLKNMSLRSLISYEILKVLTGNTVERRSLGVPICPFYPYMDGCACFNRYIDGPFLSLRYIDGPFFIIGTSMGRKFSITGTAIVDISIGLSSSRLRKLYKMKCR